jgi:glycosyltransferase involved in cell wall biosynthesis
MSILCGHPTGNPNSHNAAVGYLEAGFLECFCVPWMPTTATIGALNQIRPLLPFAQRFARRHFPPLEHAPKVQGKIGEFGRLLMRAAGLSDDYISAQSNRWLMRTMARECRRPAVTAVHAYEDCSLWQFMEAKRLGKRCIYDLPTCYYPAWEQVEKELRRKYPDWGLPEGSPAARGPHLRQKREEMDLADLVLVASRYVEATVREFYPYKSVALAPYGVDTEFWSPRPRDEPPGPLRFIYAGQVSLRKGIPLLVDAWKKAGLRDAELELAGNWALCDEKRLSLPPDVTWTPPCSPQALRDRFRASEVFVFPSFSDGFGLVLLEAMACGLPVIASESSGGPEVVTPGCGFLFSTGDLDRLVDLLRWFQQHRDQIPAMGREARSKAEHCTWSSYRRLVAQAVSELI